MRRGIVWGIAALWMSGLFTGLFTGGFAAEPEPATSRYEYIETRMGVPVRIVFYAESAEKADRAASAAYRRIAELEKTFSGPDSELGTLVRGAGGPAKRVSEDLYAALGEAQDLSRKTGGAFDITLRPLFGVWGQARKENRLPTAAEIRQARAQMGWEKIKLNPGRAVQLTQANLSADLNALAKGYAGDEVIEELKRQGISRAFYDAGGDIVAGDPPPGEKGWRVELENVPPEMPQFVLLANASVSGSGEPERFAEIDGRRYSYAINARTGMTPTEGLAVTVIAPKGSTADGLATALTAYGAEDGCALVRSMPGVTAYFRHVRIEGGGTTRQPETRRVRWTVCKSS
ncbi:MAG: FAD:protein FMN transferase [Armatimonadetes bacterium]|nr:FAD:protein FMN transferase [Armatimonadota bacterium]